MKPIDVGKVWSEGLRAVGSRLVANFTTRGFKKKNGIRRGKGQGGEEWRVQNVTATRARSCFMLRFAERL